MTKIDGELERFLAKLIAKHDDGWREHARCADTPEHLFFDEAYEDEARELCSMCPVRIECLDNAVHFDDEGFRGGLTEVERHSLMVHRQRHRGAFDADLLRAIGG